ncbi:MAG TPA: hypothetical protein PKA00_11610 [Saprospiraceae bacterium]|nr:hypothetical protein [Saprospiraceae bacterium]HMQ83550.1 hypothetical protein [Saprospiraceae bacterium]
MNESRIPKNTMRVAIAGQCLLLLLSFLPFAALKIDDTTVEATATNLKEKTFSQQATVQVFELHLQP